MEGGVPLGAAGARRPKFSGVCRFHDDYSGGIEPAPATRLQRTTKHYSCARYRVHITIHPNSFQAPRIHAPRPQKGRLLGQVVLPHLRHPAQVPLFQRALIDGRAPVLLLEQRTFRELRIEYAVAQHYRVGLFQPGPL